MSDETNASEKEHEPTQKKLDDARKKGDFARSADLNTAASYFGFLVAGSAVGLSVVQNIGSSLSALISRAPELSDDIFSGGSLQFSKALILEVLAGIFPLLLLPALAVLAAIIAQRSLVFAKDKLKPKLSRISPLANAKNKFGRTGLFEFAKSFAKLSLYGIALGAFLFDRLPQVILTIHLSPGQVAGSLFSLTLDFTIIVVLIAAGLGGVDYFWQRQEHLRKNRMSRKEVQDEHKHSEGDPHLKQKRRQRGYEIAMSKALTEVPNADVIIVNPTHYAVALKWDRTAGSAPICLCKGVDEIAHRIREIGAENAIPLHSDPPTARALHATVEIGAEILPEHYQAVAIAIRFADDMRARARQNGNLKRTKLHG